MILATATMSLLCLPVEEVYTLRRAGVAWRKIAVELSWAGLCHQRQQLRNKNVAGVALQKASRRTIAYFRSYTACAVQMRFHHSSAHEAGDAS